MNTDLFFLIFNLAHQNLWSDKIMIFCADYLIFAVFGFLIIIRIFSHPKYKMAFAISLASMVAVGLIVEIIHHFFFFPRPFAVFPIAPLIYHSPIDSTFPSLHTALMSVVAFSYFYYHSRLATVLIILTLVVGFARVFVGVHYPLDILGGFVLGFVVSFSAIKILRRFLR